MRKVTHHSRKLHVHPTTQLEQCQSQLVQSPSVPILFIVLLIVTSWTRHEIHVWKSDLRQSGQGLAVGEGSMYLERDLGAVGRCIACPMS